MSDLRARLDELTGGASRGLAIEREVEHLGLWLLELVESGAIDHGDELTFALRTPTRGARIDSCEIDVSGGAGTTTSAVLSRVAGAVDGDTLHACGAHLLAAALDRLDARVLLRGRDALTVRVGPYDWQVWDADES